MRLLIRLHDFLIFAMAVASGAILLWLMIAVIASVGIRNAGVQPWAWLFLSTEYGLLYLTMLGAPWLVREKGHVHIDIAVAALPDGARDVASRVVAAACVVVCATLAWKGVDLVSSNIERNDFDVRAYFTPRWLLTISLPVSFGFMAVEFTRFVVSREVMHKGRSEVRG